MFITKKAETLVGVVVGIFILSIVILGIGSVISSSREFINDFDKKMDLELLNSSSYNIIQIIDLSALSDGDVFYLHKNIIGKSFDIYLGEHNNQYKYIDKYGDKIDDPNNFDGDVYSRIFQAKKITYKGEEKTAVKAIIKRLIR